MLLIALGGNKKPILAGLAIVIDVVVEAVLHRSGNRTTSEIICCEKVIDLALSTSNNL